MADKLFNGRTAEQYENLKKTSPEYADMTRAEVETLIARYGGSRPCLDAIPIPADTNEVGWFQTAFGSLVETQARTTCSR
jgi:hypothetical protein